MIHHLSIAADNPLHVAQVLAEVLDGTVFPFPPVAGAFVTVCEDGHGTLVEVYPAGTKLTPGTEDQEAQLLHDVQRSRFSATHAALSVPSDETAIKTIAAREGWRAVTCNRGGLFDVVEFWIENRLMFELLTPDMARQYLDAMTLKKWAQMIEQGQD
ncbi:MAG: hypothetical protein ACU84J_12690 [Gammaproteobacteria bacterium]